MINFVLTCLAVVLPYITYLGIKAAYQNGVTDGYGYSKEPNNPGYQKAGCYLRSTMYHRWSSLREDKKESSCILSDQEH